MISIVIPAYNAQKYIVHAIESVLAQTYSDWELIVVDDCSKDKTIEVVDSYAQRYSNIRLIQRTINSGGCRIPRFEGVLAAKGEFICSIDADDFIESDFLRKMVQRQEETEADVVLDRMIICNEQGEVTNWTIPSGGFNMEQILSGREAVKLTLCGWRIAMNGMLVKREIYQDRASLSLKQGINSTFAIELEQRKLLFYADKIAMVNAHYYQRKQAESVTHLSSACYDIIEVTELCYQFIADNYADDKQTMQAMEHEYIDTIFNANRSYLSNFFSYSKELRMKYRSLIKSAYSKIKERKMVGRRRVQKLLIINRFVFDILSFIAMIR